MVVVTHFAVIASVAFRNFKALRSTSVALGRFNLVIGPNGSGKTSLIEALLRLRWAAHGGSSVAVSQSDVTAAAGSGGGHPTGHHARPAASPEIDYRFSEPHTDLVARIRCRTETDKGTLELQPLDAPAWPAIRRDWAAVRGYNLDHTAMAAPAARTHGRELAQDGANLAAVLARIRDKTPDAFSALTAEMLRITPEFTSLELAEHSDGFVELGLRLADNGLVTPSEMSQGMLYLLAMLVLAFEPHAPSVICIEDVDRGIHPRMLREVRDALYRLSHPETFGMNRRPSQVVVTTHSPYFIDLFREHPDEVIISQKQGRAARFERLTDRADLPELLREGSLGDMWFSGILGGVPDEP